MQVGISSLSREKAEQTTSRADETRRTDSSSDAESGALAAPDQLEARRRKSPSAAIVHEAVRLEGLEELERPSPSVAWSGLAAGLTMGFSLVAEGLLRSKLPEAPWRDLVSSFGYSAGFLFVTLGRQQLFTETTLTASLPLFRDRRRLSDVVRFWAIVFAANIAGTLLFAWAATVPGLFPAEMRTAFAEIGVRAAEGSFADIFYQAVGAGWLIALMVWLLPFSGAARVFVILFITYLIAGTGLAHVIAGSVETAHAAFAGAISWDGYVGYVLAALLGNTAGGVVFVALLNYAQVKEEV